MPNWESDPLDCKPDALSVCASEVTTLQRYTNVIIIIIFLGPTSTKPQAEILKLNNVNCCNDISFGDHSILEGDCISPLKSHGQALEEELCFPGVLSDNSDAPANLLCHFYGCGRILLLLFFTLGCIVPEG